MIFSKEYFTLSFLLLSLNNPRISRINLLRYLNFEELPGAICYSHRGTRFRKSQTNDNSIRIHFNKVYMDFWDHQVIKSYILFIRQFDSM